MTEIAIAEVNRRATMHRITFRQVLLFKMLTEPAPMIRSGPCTAGMRYTSFQGWIHSVSRVNCGARFSTTDASPDHGWCCFPNRVCNAGLSDLIQWPDTSLTDPAYGMR